MAGGVGVGDRFVKLSIVGLSIISLLIGILGMWFARAGVLAG